MAKTWTGAPFGVSKPRFGVDGVHPKNRLPGSFMVSTESSYAGNPSIGPGTYDADTGSFSAKAVAARASGPGWERQYELAHLTAIPYLLNKEYWQAQKMLPREMGPGKYGIVDARQDKPVSKRGMLSMRQPRFSDDSSQIAPGPGTYGYPDQVLGEKAKKSASNRAMLECGGERTFPTVGCTLGPGQYNVGEESSVDAIVRKKCSLRGPYDLFSGDRSAPPRVGHYAQGHPSKLGPGQYEFSSFLDDMDGRCKKNSGKFGTVARCPPKPTERVFYNLASYPRDPTEPSPTTYENVDSLKRSLTQGSLKALPPFLSSAKRDDRHSTQFFNGNYNPVGVGRYDIVKFSDKQAVNAHQSDFVSKSSARPTDEQAQVIRERVRATSIPPSQRTFCVKIDSRTRWFDQNKAPAERCQTVGSSTIPMLTASA